MSFGKLGRSMLYPIPYRTVKAIRRVKLSAKPRIRLPAASTTAAIATSLRGPIVSPSQPPGMATAISILTGMEKGMPTAHKLIRVMFSMLVHQKLFDEERRK